MESAEHRDRLPRAQARAGRGQGAHPTCSRSRAGPGRMTAARAPGSPSLLSARCPTCRATAHQVGRDARRRGFRASRPRSGPARRERREVVVRVHPTRRYFEGDGLGPLERWPACSTARSPSTEPPRSRGLRSQCAAADRDRRGRAPRLGGLARQQAKVSATLRPRRERGDRTALSAGRSIQNAHARELAALLGEVFRAAANPLARASTLLVSSRATASPTQKAGAAEAAATEAGASKRKSRGRPAAARPRRAGAAVLVRALRARAQERGDAARSSS